MQPNFQLAKYRCDQKESWQLLHIPTWENMLGAGNTMSSGTEEEWASKENCNAIARERDASCGGKNVLHGCPFVSGNWNFR